MNEFRIALLGVIGSGKTTLFNHLTQNKEPARSGGDSVTKQVVVGFSNIVDRLKIIDTPGFDVNVDKILHAAGVIAALIMGDLNRILINQKFDRNERMITELKTVINPIRRYRDIITIVVSHWDLSEDKQEDEKNITKIIKENFNIGSVLFYSKKDDPKIISLSILKIIEESKNMTIKLTDTEIFSQFDLLSMDPECQNKLEQDKEEIVKKFRVTTNVFKKYIDESINLNDPKSIDILHCMSLEIKKIADSQIEEFEKQHGEYMNTFYDTNHNNVRYLHHIYLKLAVVADLENVIRKAQEKMTKTKNSYFQYLKQCPNCKLIWMKVVGCEKETTCGNRVNFHKDDILKKSSTLNRYKFSIKQDQLQVEPINPKNNSPQQQANSLEDWLYRIVKYDQNFNNSLGNNFSQDQLINLLYTKIGKNFYILKFKYSLGLIGYNDQQMIQYLQEQCDIKKVNSNQNKQFGCGQRLVWKELPILSGPEFSELLSTELIDFFSDKEQLIKEESKFLEQYYKDQVYQAISDQIKKAKILQKIN